MGELRVGIVGLASSHPYAFADILARRGVNGFFVWDEDLDKARAFAGGRDRAAAFASVEELLTRPIDGVLICTESYRHVEYALPFLERGNPAFIDKVMTLDGQGLSALTKAAEKWGTPFFSASSLRFSPEFARLRKLASNAKGTELLGVSATVFHSIAGHLEPGNTWQDEKGKGGGTLINMGVHGLELLFSILGPGVKRVWATTAARYYKQSRSEDTALIHLDYGEGLLGTVRLVCGTDFHRYGMELYLHDSHHRVMVPDGEGDVLSQVGYLGLMDAFLEMVRSKTAPVPLSETLSLVRALLACRTSAETGQWIELPR